MKGLSMTTIISVWIAIAAAVVVFFMGAGND
jgi:hypothetical protein